MKKPECRPADTYRGARRNEAKERKLPWALMPRSSHIKHGQIKVMLPEPGVEPPLVVVGPRKST